MSVVKIEMALELEDDYAKTLKDHLEVYTADDVLPDFLANYPHLADLGIYDESAAVIDWTESP